MGTKVLVEIAFLLLHRNNNFPSFISCCWQRKPIDLEGRLSPSPLLLLSPSLAQLLIFVTKPIHGANTAGVTEVPEPSAQLTFMTARMSGTAVDCLHQSRGQCVGSGTTDMPKHGLAPGALGITVICCCSLRSEYRDKVIYSSERGSRML